MAGAPRELISLDADWRFQKGDPEGTGDQVSYLKSPAVKEAIIASSAPSGLSPDQSKLGASVAYTQKDFKDSAWRKLNLPHDWAIEGPFDIKLPGKTGKLPYAGVGWYRKHFALSPTDEGRQVALEIDGAMSYAMVWCNGQFVGGWPYGYSSFSLNLTPHLKIGGDNVLTIRLENPDESSRWYPGAGIYRNVWLVKTAPVHISHWGTYLTTPEITTDKAKVNLRVSLENHSPVNASVEVKTDLQYDGKSVGTLDCGTIVVPSNGKVISEGAATLSNPQLWNIETPRLYSAVTTVTHSGKIVDRYETPFGIRKIEFTADNGFLLNGNRVQLQGVCDHHDLGALGAAFNLRAAQRQLQILKEMGVNAIRTSHNPPAPELLDLCDKMGILVMDESFDCWKIGKTPNDYNRLWDDWHEKDLRAEYSRDRNHPSIIMWSLGNEIREQGKPQAAELFAELVGIAHEEDPTRPTTLGGNGIFKYDPSFSKSMELAGENYMPGIYADFHLKHPALPLFGSETSSTVSSRGEYFFETTEDFAKAHDHLVKAALAHKSKMPATEAYSPLPKEPVPKNYHRGTADFQVTSYDLYYPGWATTPDQEFKALVENPFVAGEFVWTGFDYLGEPTPYNNDVTNLLNFHDAASKAAAEQELTALGKIHPPSRSSYFGIIDLAGFKKDRFYLYQAHWRPNFPMVHILPHWNWPDRVGQVTPVFVYTSGDEVELFLNGKSLGRQKQQPLEYRFRWDNVVYAPGELKAVAYKNGKPWADETVKTTGPATGIKLEVDRPTIKRDGLDLAYVTARVVDANGLTVPVAMNTLKFIVESGPGEIVATDNGDATDLNRFSNSERKAFNGLALAIVKFKPGESGDIQLSATSDGLQPGCCLIHGE
jgi:beta-galactosidase